jgi:hypothetical protein
MALRIAWRTDVKSRSSPDGWIADVVVPFARRNQPTIAALGETFSSFVPWKSKTVEEHVMAITNLIGEAWKLRAEGAVATDMETNRNRQNAAKSKSPEGNRPNSSH